MWEVDPPSLGDTTTLDAQARAIDGLATTVLVPDNHTGRATISSIAIARRLVAPGRRTMACLNARDRNLLGLRRDLLTCAFEGIDDVLLVFGDDPSDGSRASDLTVRRMMDEARSIAPDLGVGVTTRLGPLPAWKRAADTLFVQVAYDLDALRAWRSTIDVDVPVVAAVMVIPSVAMATRLGARIPELRVPDRWLDAIAADAAAGIDLAARILDEPGFGGVHVVSGRHHTATAERLRTRLAATSSPRPVPGDPLSHDHEPDGGRTRIAALSTRSTSS